jgi:hypothetical protein
MTRPWLERTKEEDIEEARRQERERIDAFLNHPSYQAEAMEMGDAQRARNNPNRPETIDTALYGKEVHAPSRRMLRCEQRRGLRQEEDYFS